MFQQIFNWRSGLAFIAILIVTGTIFYSRYLARKIATEERIKVEQWVDASKSVLDPKIADPRFAFKIMKDNTDIPIIQTDERDSIMDYVNLDSVKAKNEKWYLPEKLKDFKS